MFKKISKNTLRLFSMLLTLSMIFSSVSFATPAVAATVETADETANETVDDRITLLSTETDEDYIEISTIQDLYNVRRDLTANYILMNDIDLTDATAPGGVWDFNGSGWNPIGSNDIYSNEAFSGIFDGNGHSIIGMRIETTSFPDGTGDKVYLGLFSNVIGTVKNLNIFGEIYAKSSSKSFYVGGISAYSNGKIDNCCSIVDINISSTCSDKISSYVGGIVGYASGGTISNCVNKGCISVIVGRAKDTAYAAGIVGYGANNDTNINCCYNNEDVVSKGSSYDYSSSSNGFPGYAYASGIVNNKATVENCYNVASICASYTGSLRYRYGYAYGIGGSTVSKSYNIGDVSGETSSYGVANGTITDCYYLLGTGESSAGSTSLTKEQLLLSSLYVGFDFNNIWTQDVSAEYSYPQLKSNIQDLRVSTAIRLSSVPEKTEYKFGEKLDLTGGTIVVSYYNDEDQILSITDDMVSGYDAEASGSQTITVTYKGKTVTFDVTVKEKVYNPVYTIEDLYNVRLDLDANYILMNDIDLTDATAKGGDWDFMENGWNPIGSNDIYSNEAFSGEFDGNAHKIIGMRIDVTKLHSGTDDVYLGLFSNITGKVYDLSFVGGSINYEISNKTAYAGALCALAENADISNVSNKIDFITGSAESLYVSFGGIIGKSTGSVIYKCSNDSNFEAKAKNLGSAIEYVGGIVGESSKDTITECYNTGTIDAYSPYGNSTNKAYIGGICGYGSSSITDCYNSGDMIADTGSTFGKAYAAGIAVEGTVSQCYNVGTIAGISRYGVGGTSVSNSYYLKNSGSSNNGSTALTESQMRIQSMYKGFDFENTWLLNEFANHPYPQLINNIQNLSESASLVSIISLPIKTEYMTNDELDFTGAMVKVVYVSGKEEIIDITEDMVSGFDMSIAGKQTVMVTVAGASDSYTINVVERPIVSSIEIISQPDIKIFAVGTSFDFTGAKALVSYVDGVQETVNLIYDMTSGGDINHIGKQTITYSFGGKSASFEVEVVGIEIDEIILTSLPNKLYYLEGEKLELEGMVLTAVMNNGIKNTIASGYTVDGYSSEPGEYRITISYLGKEAYFDVTVAKRKLLKLTLNALPDKREYFSGEEFDDSGMQIIATYDNSDVIVAEDYTLEGFDDNPGIKNIVVSLEGKSVSFTVKVVRRVVTELIITSLPSKLDYIEYESFDESGLVVEATYNDGVTEEIIDYELAGFVSRPGTHIISVAYEGFVETFEINVSPRILEEVKVIAPDKVAYEIGEEFDDTGLVVTACYNNGQEITLDKSDYQISGFDSAAPGTKSIKVSYNGIERSFAVVVYERTSVETGGHMTVGTAIGRLGEEVTIPVIVTKNTGIAGFKHDISFDADNLAFVAVEMVGDFTDGSLVVNDENADEGKLNLVWYDSKDASGDGTVYNIVFEILETAIDGDTDITINFEENGNGNVSGENVTFTPANGSVEIRSYWLGDLNGDRQFRVADLLYLAQYVVGIEKTLTDKQKLSADVNEDTIIDIHDVIMLQQWIVNAGVPNAQTFALLAAVDDMVEDATKISLGEIKGKVGQEVVVPVTIENNVGISAFMFEVAYDTTDLTFVSAEIGGVLDKGVLITQVDEENQRLIVLWYSTEGDVSADGEMLPLTFKINDTASGTYDLSVRYLAEGILNEARDEILCSIESGKILVGSVLTGNLTSLLVDGNNDVTLVLSNGTEVVDELSINKGDFQFDSVAPGEYTLTVEKKNHATRTYTITVGDEDIALDVKLNLLGDIDGNGSVNMMDYLKAKQHSQNKNLLEGYAFDCADVSGDGKVNMMDYIKLKQHAQNISSIWE